jgi:hypothetical protein
MRLYHGRRSLHINGLRALRGYVPVGRILRISVVYYVLCVLLKFPFLAGEGGGRRAYMGSTRIPSQPLINVRVMAGPPLCRRARVPSQPCSALALSPRLCAIEPAAGHRLPPPHAFVSAHSPLLAVSRHMFGEMLQRVFSLLRKCEGTQAEQAKVVCHGPAIQQHEHSYIYSLSRFPLHTACKQVVHTKGDDASTMNSSCINHHYFSVQFKFTFIHTDLHTLKQ